MKIRRAAASDLASISRLSVFLGASVTDSQTGERLERILADEGQVVLVAVVKGEVVGWVHAFQSDRLQVRPFAELGGLVVDRSLRGRKIGTELMGAAERWAQGRGLSALRVRSNVSRDEAHEFYERQGYRRAKQQAVFVKGLVAPHR